MTAISVKNLSKKFKNITAVDDLSFEVADHRVVGFLGPNGSGKTTTLRMMVGLSKPTAGEIKIAKTAVVFGGEKSNNKVGYLPELPSFYLWMSGLEYLNFIADLFEIKSDKKIKLINELLDLVSLTEAKNKKISTYSGGMKQRLGIAQALINNPEVIILDEPVSALDPIGRKDVLDVIGKLKEKHTILFSTHILSDVDKICDDVVIINKGKLIVSDSLSGLKSKYAKSILEVEMCDDVKNIGDLLKHEKWVSKVNQSGRIIKIWLNDDGVMKKNIPLLFFANHKIGVLSYGIRLPQIEDLFVELLGESK